MKDSQAVLKYSEWSERAWDSRKNSNLHDWLGKEQNEFLKWQELKWEFRKDCVMEQWLFDKDEFNKFQLFREQDYENRAHITFKLWQKARKNQSMLVPATEICSR